MTDSEIRAYVDEKIRAAVIEMTARAASAPSPNGPPPVQTMNCVLCYRLPDGTVKPIAMDPELQAFPVKLGSTFQNPIMMQSVPAS